MVGVVFYKYILGQIFDNAIQIFFFGIILSVIERETTKSLTMHIDVSVSSFMSIFLSHILKL